MCMGVFKCMELCLWIRYLNTERSTGKGQGEVGRERVSKNDESQIDISANGRKNTASEDKSERRSTF